MSILAHIFVIALLAALTAVIASNGVAFVKALRKHRAGAAAPGELFFHFTLLQISIACAVFTLPFASVFHRWIRSGSWEIITVEIALFALLLILGLIGARATAGREMKGAVSGQPSAVSQEKVGSKGLPRAES